MSLLSKADKAALVKAGTIVIAPKGKKVNAVEIDGLEDYAIADALIKTLIAIKDTLGEPVKDQSRSVFLQSDGIKRPANFKAVDGEAEASIQLKKRTTASRLSDTEVALLQSKDIPFDTVDDVPEAYAINPKYLTDSALLARIEKVKGLPDDFIVKQVAVSKHVVSDETVDAVFSKGLAHELLDVVTSLAVKAKLNSPAEKKTLEFVKSVLSSRKN